MKGWKDADFYICGPGPFMDAVEEVLKGIGVAEDRIFIERFESPPDPHEVSEEEIAEAASDTAPAGDVPEVLTIVLDGARHEVAYTRNETVLQAARVAGLQPPFSCEDGYCGCCMAKLKDGEVQMRRNDCLSKKDLKEGWVLTCQSVPVSRTLAIDYDDS